MWTIGIWCEGQNEMSIEIAFIPYVHVSKNYKANGKR